MNVDIAILTEAKITNDIYTCFSCGYQIMATHASSAHQGGLALVWRERPGFCIESITLHDANLLSFELVASRRRWLIVGIYLSPNDMATTICNKSFSKYITQPTVHCHWGFQSPPKRPFTKRTRPRDFGNH
jgi:hypothetical protein